MPDEPSQPDEGEAAQSTIGAKKLLLKERISKAKSFKAGQTSTLTSGDITVQRVQPSPLTAPLLRSSSIIISEADADPTDPILVYDDDPTDRVQRTDMDPDDPMHRFF